MTAVRLQFAFVLAMNLVHGNAQRLKLPNHLDIATSVSNSTPVF